MNTQDGPGRPGLVKTVTSLANPLVKDIRALSQRKHRQATGLFVAEGLKLVADAIEAGWPIKTFVHAEKVASHELVTRTAARVVAHGGLVLKVSEAVLEKMTRRDNPQMVIGVFEQKTVPLDAIDTSSATVWIALEGIKDPGNLGTILRTADAVGASGVLLVGDTVDPFGTEAVRATMGSIFHVRLARASVEAFKAWRPGWPGTVVGTHLSATEDYRAVSYEEPVLLFMGNEQSGLPEDLAGLCDRLVKIPMAGKADSLNLAVSTAVMLYEVRRGQLTV
ncbi:TrmH family RNA methyltransferase [Rhodobium orientis]|uniref:RNA methyltransferase n=1 Tax=Rhodobium orientis TaxID=34017 RepID=A0A327JHW5_9HYPH|nr:RNA methyltransferase [Rhodobium orientis]MBB4302039.1 TrmH family RNA methyltransferase [Rhodobium orientis]MBK5950276.1 RNA methyltransferase [Rhodobium orientis]RAI25980.1 RNA methyltransferase [Rhodobium orientis]